MVASPKSFLGEGLPALIAFKPQCLITLRKVTRYHNLPTNKGDNMIYTCIYRCGHKDTATINEPYADKAWNNPELCNKCKTKAKDKKKGVKK